VRVIPQPVKRVIAGVGVTVGLGVMIEVSFEISGDLLRVRPIFTPTTSAAKTANNAMKTNVFLGINTLYQSSFAFSL
jgi:hypothetical protein